VHAELEDLGRDSAAAGVTARAVEPRAGIDRRAQILDAARAVLSRQGYAETSTKDIAAEAGVAPGLLHYYFESKEEILIQVVEGVAHEIGESHREAVRGVTDPLEAVAQAMDKAAERCGQPGFCRLLLDAYSLALNSPAINARLRPTLDEMIRSTAETADEVIGGLPFAEMGPLTTKDIAIALVGAMDGVAMATTLHGDDPTGAYRALKAMVLAYVAMSFVLAGQEPPLAKLVSLVYSQK
jgi:AcrR family transcriptional regulator